jgi:hypothetical protein
MFDHGLHLTLRAVRRQMAAMPHDLNLIRLIHSPTRRAFPGERLWTAAQLLHPATLRFLRVRNPEGCDVTFSPTRRSAIPAMSWWTWIAAASRSSRPCGPTAWRPAWCWKPAPATFRRAARQHHAAGSGGGHRDRQAIGSPLRRRFGQHRLAPPGPLGGLHQPKAAARNLRLCSLSPGALRTSGLVAERAALLDAAQASLLGPPKLASPAHWPVIRAVADPPFAGGAHLYADWLHRLRIPERFAQPDWSIADKWIAKELLRRGMSATQAAVILRTGSPGFPRRHSDPEDHLSRTLARAARRSAAAALLIASPPPPVCQHESQGEPVGQRRL